MKSLTERIEDLAMSQASFFYRHRELYGYESNWEIELNTSIITMRWALGCRMKELEKTMDYQMLYLVSNYAPLYYPTLTTSNNELPF